MFFERIFGTPRKAEVEAMLAAQSAQINREIDAMPEAIAYEKAKEEVRKARGRVRMENMDSAPPLEAGDVLLAKFANPEEGSDRFLITIESVSPGSCSWEVVIKSRAVNPTKKYVSGVEDV